MSVTCRSPRASSLMRLASRTFDEEVVDDGEMAHFLHCHVEDDPSPLRDGRGLPLGQPLLATAFEAEGGIQVRAQDIVLQLGSLRKEVDQGFASLGIRNRWHHRWLSSSLTSDGTLMRNPIIAEERLA